MRANASFFDGNDIRWFNDTDCAMGSGSCVNFTGNFNYLNFGDRDGLWSVPPRTIDQCDFTITQWIKPSQIADMYLWNKIKFGGSSEDGYWMFLSVDSNKPNIDGCRAGNCGGSITASSGVGVNGWTMVTGVFLCGGRSQIYINTTMVANSTNVVDMQFDENPILFGAWDEDVANARYEGMVDEIRFYNDTLLGVEIEAIFDFTIPPPPVSISNINCTNCYREHDTIAENLVGEDPTTPFAFDTNVNAFCAISDFNSIYTEKGVSRNCTSGEGSKLHGCTIIVGDALSFDSNNISISCVNDNRDSEDTINTTMYLNDPPDWTSPLGVVSVNTTRLDILEFEINKNLSKNITDQNINKTLIYTVTINGSVSKGIIWSNTRLNLSVPIDTTIIENITITVNDTFVTLDENITVNLTAEDFLKLDLLISNRTYEYETNASITSNLGFIDILDNTGRFTNVSSPFDYLIDLLRINNYNDSTTTKTIFASSMLNVSVDARFEIYNMTINISGSAENVSIDINNDSIADFMITGNVSENKYKVTSFVFDNQESQVTNITFFSAGIKVIEFNLTTNEPTAPGNITFTLTGFDIDNGNALDFNFYFNATDKLNASVNQTINISSPLGIFDNFEIDDTESDWEGTITAGGCGTHTFGFTQGANDNKVFVQGSGTCPGTSSSTPSAAEIVNTVLDLRTNSLIKMDYGAKNGPIGDCVNTGASLTMLAGDTSVLINNIAEPATVGDIRLNITLRRSSPDSDIWEKFENGELVGTISTSNLDRGEKWTIKLSESAQSFCLHTQGSVTTQSDLFILELGGIYLNKTQLGTSYTNKNGSWESNTIHNTERVINAVWLFVNETKPLGTNIEYFVSTINGSPDNGSAASYESIIPGFRTPITKVKGSGLRIWVNMTTENLDLTPRVHSMNVRVIPTSLQNISVTLGTDEIISLTGTFNTTFIYNSSTSIIASYLNVTNCGTDITCRVPLQIKALSSGEIQFSDLNITKGFNPVSFNTSLISNISKINLSISFDAGNLTVNDLRFDYRGDKNITILAHTATYSTNISRLLRVRYSKFGVSIMPPSIDEWSLAGNLYSSNQNNIPPFGNPDNDGNPFYNVTQLIWDHKMNIYIRYNESVNTCQNTTFTGTNITGVNTTFNVVLNESAKILIQNLSTKGSRNISTFTDVSCSAQNSTLLFPYFCFLSLCSECVITSDWDSNCEFEI